MWSRYGFRLNFHPIGYAHTLLCPLCCQIHIFEYAAGSMLISWATQTAAPSSEVVYYGTTPSCQSSVTGSSNVLSKNMTTPLRLHDAMLTGLAGNNQVPQGAAAAARTYWHCRDAPNNHIVSLVLDSDLNTCNSTITALVPTRPCTTSRAAHRGPAARCTSSSLTWAWSTTSRWRQ